MTVSHIKHYGKLYNYERSFLLKKDAEELVRDFKRDGDKTAIIRRGESEFGSKQLGTHEIKRVWDVYWRRK